MQIKVNGNDVICNQCVELFNQMDRHESNFELVKSNIRSLLIKKNGINDNGNATDGAAGSITNAIHIEPPPHQSTEGKHNCTLKC